MHYLLPQQTDIDENDTMKVKKKSTAGRLRYFRLVIAHLLCAIHMGITIFVLYATVMKTYFYFIPLFGTILLGVEAAISLFCYRCREYYRGFSVLVFVYSATIIASIWVLELHRIQVLKVQAAQTMPISFQNPPIFRPGFMPNLWVKPQTFLLSFKDVWSQVEIQVYLFFLIILRALLTRQQSTLSYFDKTDLLFKYFATGSDLRDFLDLLSYPQLYSNSRLVYVTLIIWSISCLQFIIYIPEVKDDDAKQLRSFLANSSLTILLADFPFLIVRLYAIFGCGKHDYTSYFFVLKNILLILMQLARILAFFLDRKQARNDQLAKLTYNPQPPFNTRGKGRPLAAPLPNERRRTGARVIFSNYGQYRQPADGQFSNTKNSSNV